MVFARIRFALVAVCAFLGSAVNLVQAGPVLAGYDYLVTLPGTQFDSPFGIIALTGVPINPSLYGAADTIVERLADANFPSEGVNLYPGAPTAGTDTTIPIELVALQLQSIAPFQIGSNFFDVFVTLDSTPSLGTMTIDHQWADSGDSLPEGTFDSFFDVFATVTFTPTGAGTPFQLPVNLQLTSTGNLWSHEPYGFYIPDPITEVHPGVGIHVAEQTIIPEANSAVLLTLTAVSAGLVSRLVRSRSRPGLAAV